MAKKPQRKSAKKSADRALNAFTTATDDDYYIKGLRQQQDIDLEHISDDRIRDLLSNRVNSEDDEDIDSDEAMGSASDISLGEPDSDDEGEWGDSVDEDELLPLSEVWDLDDKAESDNEESKSKKSSIAKSTEVKSQPADSGNDDSGSEGDDESNSDGSDSGDESIGLSDSEYGSAENESEDEEDNVALRQAIKNVSGTTDTGVSNTKLVEADAENPFSLPQSSATNDVSLQSFVPGADAVKPLSIPAAKRVQERADREAAYGLAKEEVDKWTDTVAANRRAEHLQFPAKPPPQFQAASPFVPTAPTDRNDLEDKVAQILNASQLADEKQASTFEETAPSALSLEDLKKRRNQLRYMRDLMFREEQRAKRIKKIKSKTYRRIHKKERERMAELERGSDEEEDGNSIDRAERDRALERATLRHKNNSKWAKRMLEQGLTRDSNTRGDIEEMLRQSDALRQKIRGQEEEEEEFDDERAMNFSDQESDDQSHGNKGVLGMKFMRDAEKRERDANKKMLQDDFDSQSEDENIGRKSFNPAGQQLKRDIEAVDAAEEDEDRRNTSEKKKQKRGNAHKVERGDEIIEFRQQVDDDAEPAGGVTATSQSRPTASDSASSKKLSGTNPDNAAASTDISSNPWLAASANATTPNTVKLASSAAAARASGEKASKNPHNAKIVLENTLGDSLVREKDLTLQQQDLVRQAFAGDDVVSAFEAEKQAEVAEDKDQEIDETLPGWGSWSNEKPRIQKVRKIAGLNEKQRKDYKKANVVINEKLNKKAAKYNASAVPFPFENRQQYERSLRMPIGQEWTTKDTFQRQTKPRVLVKRGTIIDPIKKPRSN